MSKRIQLRRGTTTEHNAFTGANGEVTYDTTTKQLVLHDGTTMGGFRIPQVDSSGKVVGIPVINNLTTGGVNNVLSAEQGKVLQNTKSTVAVMTGTIADGGTIPLPSGFTEDQCKWIVSVRDLSGTFSGNNTGSDILNITCFTTGRVVTAKFTFRNTTTGTNANNISHTVNYMIIGVK